jgi:predicted nuclease of predicted toxin-antitoxin system
MKTLLIDHDIEGQGNFLWGTLVKDGWLSLVPIEFVNFQDVGLPFESNDREVWRFAQANNMILLTAN